VTIEVANRTKSPEIVHWHGLFLPPEVDGSMEEGTPMIPPGGKARYTFTPRPAGFRWYHTHTFAGHDFKMSTSVRRKLPVTRPLTVAGYETVPPPSGLHRGTRALTNQTAFLRQPLCKEHLQRCIIFLENQPATLPGWVQLGSGVSKYNELWRTLQHSRPAARVTRTLVACNG
jgi:hypothetical protein